MRIISKQKGSKLCFVCGVDNPIGLKAHFYNMEDGSVMTKFMYKKIHQSFPQRVHGGLITTILDELSLRAYWTKDENILGVTTSMETKFRKPLPYDIEVIGKGIIAKETSRFIIADVSLMDTNEVVYANATVNLIKMPVEKITDIDFHKEMCFTKDPINLKEI